MARTGRKIANGDWFSQMKEHFQRGRFRASAQYYDDAIREGQRPEVDAILLRARLFLKTDNEKLTSFLLRSKLVNPSEIQIARRALYLGTSYTRLGDFAEADKYFADAKAAMKTGAIRAELAAHLTRRYLAQRDIESAQEWQRESLVDRSLVGKVRSEHLQSYIFARTEAYKDQALSLVRVLDLIGEKRENFVEDYCVATYTLSVLARELPVPSLARRAKSEIDSAFAWPEDFKTYRFQALKGVAWCQALSGDELSCLRYLRLAGHIAPHPVWQVVLFCDRAYFASIVGEERWAANEFSAAEELADSIEWQQTSGEERVALLLLAELAASQAPKRAPYYLARFNELGRLRSHLQHLAFDERLTAMVAYASGVVSASAGDIPKAQEHLRSAWSTFDRISYDVRAARAAIALYRATDKARWLHLAEDKLENYGHSWLLKTLIASSSAVGSKKIELPKMQNQVVQLVCRGLSTDLIAAHLNISRNTVLNHLKAVYKKLGVNSREALVVKVMSDGLI
ncbi:MAG TPA: helix-turn-helix transcriptional regulator [Candidatus Tumulicola sp.]|jgi:DNA-binding CsgD family transcriptional regulator